jgi:hypothetical protein
VIWGDDRVGNGTLYERGLGTIKALGYLNGVIGYAYKYNCITDKTFGQTGQQYQVFCTHN